MAGIYGPITEHPELPMTDSGRFTVVIKTHPYRAAPVDLTSRCERCGYGPRHAVHKPPFEVTDDE